MENNESFGDRLRSLRKGRKLTQAKLAERTQLTKNLISDYENDRKKPRFDNLLILAKALDVSVDILLGHELPKTLGSVLEDYLDALRMSNGDKLIIDKKNKTVSIEINTPEIKGILLNSADFLALPSPYNKAMESFCVYLLSEIPITN